MKSPYDLDNLLTLLEQRESILAKIQTIELPEFVINNEQGHPVFKIHFSRFGDLVILRNPDVSANLSASYTDLGELLSDLDSDIADSYLMKAVTRGTPSSIRIGRLTRSNPVEALISSEQRDPVHWTVVLAIPITKCLDITKTLFSIFKDDLLNNSE